MASKSNIIAKFKAIGKVINKAFEKTFGVPWQDEDTVGGIGVLSTTEEKLEYVIVNKHLKTKKDKDYLYAALEEFCDVASSPFYSSDAAIDALELALEDLDNAIIGGDMTTAEKTKVLASLLKIIEDLKEQIPKIFTPQLKAKFEELQAKSSKEFPKKMGAATFDAPAESKLDAKTRAQIEALKEKFADALESFENEVDDADMKIVGGVYTSFLHAGNLYKHKLLFDLSNLFADYSINWEKAFGSLSPVTTFNAMFKSEFKRMTSSSSLSDYGLIGVKDFVKLISGLPKLLKATITKYVGKGGSVGKKAEAPSTAPLGQIAFAPARDGVPFEPNTKVEQDLYDALVQHFRGGHFLNSKQAELMRKILAKGLYSNVIHEPAVEFVYRGMSVPKVWLAKALKVKPENLPRKGVMEKSFTFTPKQGESSSWTTSKSTASNFADDVSRDRPFSVIIYAEIDRNPNRFVAGPGGLYKIKGPSNYSDEKEAVALGNIKVSKITWEKDEYSWEKDEY
jgi:hypothetical protein